MCQLASAYSILIDILEAFRSIDWFYKNARACRGDQHMKGTNNKKGTQLSKKQSRNAMKINLTSLTFWANTNIEIKGRTTTEIINRTYSRWVDKVTVCVCVLAVCVCEWFLKQAKQTFGW